MNALRARALLVLLLLGYWAISLSNLTVLPIVYEDEPWQISTGWKLAAEGVFGSDLFAGYHGRENYYYGYLPLHPVAMAGVFRIAGLGLFQARFETVACGLLILALTFRLARRLFHDSRIGLGAIAILILVRGFGRSPLHPTGILFLDVVRVARYDVLVPVFGLAALHLYLTASERKNNRLYFLTGLLCALAGLTHLYGAFFLLVVVALILWNPLPNRRRALFALALGFSIPWLFYLGYVLQDLESWRAQVRDYQDRFGILDMRWYLENLNTEWERYTFGVGPTLALLSRPGLVLSFLGLPVALFALARRAVQSHERAARVLLVPLVLFPILFALLIRLKFTNYLFVVAPFAALALAWLVARAWNATRAVNRSAWLRPALAMLALFVVLEGVFQIAALEIAAQTTTPYDTFIARVRAPIPRQARVLGLQNYGLGWENYNYRSLAIPFLLTNPSLQEQPLDLETALDIQQADYILVDTRIQKFLKTTDDATRAAFQEWMQAHNAVEIARVYDAAYGTIEIYKVNR